MPGILIGDKTVEIPFYDTTLIAHKAIKINPELYEKVKYEL